MTLNIYREHGRKCESIENVVTVLNYSTSTARGNGNDIEVQYINEEDTIKVRKIHLERYEFYSVWA